MSYKNIFYFIFVLFSTSLFAQSPNWSWAKSGNGSQNDYSYSTAADASNNVYVAGTFSSSTISFGSFTLINSGYNNAFLVKYDPAGTVMWAKTNTGYASAFILSITVDGSGNIYATGEYGGASITFGSITLNNSNGLGDVFIVKYDPSGNVIWAKAIHGRQSETGRGIHVNTSGLYLGGYFSSDTLNIGTTALYRNLSGVTDAFIAKYDLNGNSLWAKSIKGDSFDEIYGITTDVSGNVFVTGSSNSSFASFGSFTINNSTGANGNYEAFLAKYSALGNFVWAKSIHGNYDEHSTSITVDPSGNLIIAGYFNSDSVFCQNHYALNQLAGNFDVFLAKFDNNGTALWAEGAGGNKGEIANGIASDATGNIFVTGAFPSDTMNFGGFSLFNDTIGTGTGYGTTDIFVAKYSSAGNIVWAKSVGQSGDESGKAIVLDNNNNVIICGDYQGNSTCDFGGHIVNNVNGYNFDVFLAKLNSIVGIEAISLQTGVEIYPNPCNYGLNIESKNFSLKRLILTNLLGNTVFQINYGLTNFERVDVSNLPDGIYFATVFSGTSVLTRKIIVQHH